MNPFVINAMPIDSASHLYYREREVAELKTRVDGRRQTVILGPEGVGKSSLLRSTFNREYRIEKALNSTLITPVTEFPSDLKDGDTLYTHFAEMIISSVRILSQCGMSDVMNSILSECNSLRNEDSSPEVYFKKIVGLIHGNYEYRIVMVVDNFERFTSSIEVTKTHHGVLLSLLDYLQFIAATNYDLNEDSLPAGIFDSLLLTRFVGNEIRVGGWSKEQTHNFIQKMLSESDLSFSDSLIETICDIAGGVPKLLNIAANYAYDYILKNNSESGIKLISPLYEKDMVCSLFFHWCKMLQPRQITALKHLLENENDCDTYKEILRVLYMRGILDYKTSTDEIGNSNTSDKDYVFCNELFAYFCSIDGNLELAASKNPLIGLHSTTPREPVATSAENLNSAIKNAMDSARHVLDKLDDLISKAAEDSDSAIAEYRELGNRPVSENSDYMRRLKKKASDIATLNIKLNAKFDIIFEQIESASSREQLCNIELTVDNTCWEIEQELNALNKGV